MCVLHRFGCVWPECTPAEIMARSSRSSDSRDKVKHNGRNDQLFFREDDEGGRARVTTDEEQVYCEDNEQR